MNYRDHNPCLPPDGYYPLIKATCNVKREPSNVLRRILKWLGVGLLVTSTATVAGSFKPDPAPQSLVWVQPEKGRTMPPPPVLPAEGNPWSF
jgi:hypothetical protein